MKLIDENKYKPAITLRRIMDKSSPITRVFYDEDGEWQFFDSGEMSDSDYMVVGVGQVMSIDDSLLFLPEMNPRDKVRRKSQGEVWEKF